MPPVSPCPAMWSRTRTRPGGRVPGREFGPAWSSPVSPPRQWPACVPPGWCPTCVPWMARAGRCARPSSTGITGRWSRLPGSGHALDGTSPFRMSHPSCSGSRRTSPSAMRRSRWCSTPTPTSPTSSPDSTAPTTTSPPSLERCTMIRPTSGCPTGCGPSAWTPKCCLPCAGPPTWWAG